MTFDGSKEKRYFTAVAGDSTQQGELFGVKNLFQPLRKETSLTIDILKVKNFVFFLFNWLSNIKVALQL